VGRAHEQLQTLPEKKHLNDGELQEIVCKSGFKKFWHQCPLYLSQAPFHKAANANTTDATWHNEKSIYILHFTLFDWQIGSCGLPGYDHRDRPAEPNRQGTSKGL